MTNLLISLPFELFSAILWSPVSDIYVNVEPLFLFGNGYTYSNSMNEAKKKRDIEYVFFISKILTLVCKQTRSLAHRFIAHAFPDTKSPQDKSQRSFNRSDVHCSLCFNSGPLIDFIHKLVGRTIIFNNICLNKAIETKNIDAAKSIIRTDYTRHAHHVFEKIIMKCDFESMQVLIDVLGNDHIFVYGYLIKYSFREYFERFSLPENRAKVARKFHYL